MANNRGKQFEIKLKQDWEKCFGPHSIDRIYDSVSGFAGVTNICDFIGFKKPNIFYLEAKSHLGASFPLSNLSQYEKLKVKVGIEGMRAGVVLWLIDKDTVTYWPIKTIIELKEAGIKSINPEKLKEKGYRFIEIPSIKKRVFMDSDYSVLMNLEEGD